MDPDLLALLGPTIGVDELNSEQARAVAHFLRTGPSLGCQLVEARRTEGGSGELFVAQCESLILQVHPDLVQRPFFDIRDVEYVAAVFAHESRIPTVLPLRKDFPLAPHTNDTPPGVPVTLCLYRQPWSEVRLTWTPGTFVQRIRWWLETTAEGGLYGGENPIEPLFFTAPRDLIVGRELYLTFFAGTLEDTALQVKALDQHGQLLLLEKASSPDPHFLNRPSLDICFVYALTPTIADGRVRNAPQRLSRLDEILGEFGFDLVSELRSQLARLMANSTNHKKNFGLLIAARVAASEGMEARRQLTAFISPQTISEAAIALGEYGAVGDGTVGRLLSGDMTRKGEEVVLDPVNVGMDIDPEEIAALSGFQADRRKTVLVGAGTLGSTLFDTLVRQGFGAWTIIDPDMMRPHNLPRHIFHRNALGKNKAQWLSTLAVAIANERPIAIECDLLAPGDKDGLLQTALNEADLILDATASAAVARALANHPACGRRVSTFFLGDAKAIALLVEARDRSARIDDLECVFVAEAIVDDRVAAILSASPTELATPASCRAPTSRVPWNRAVAFSGLVAEAIRDRTEVESGSIIVHAWVEATATIETVDVTAPPFVKLSAGEWSIRLSSTVVDELRNLRNQHLPVETGGALFGAVDTWNRTIHVVAHFSDLSDSVGTTSSFQRGMSGIGAFVRDVGTRTRNAITYVGEWHSHPSGASAEASETDLDQLAGLAELVSRENRPALSIIVSATDVTAWIRQL